MYSVKCIKPTRWSFGYDKDKGHIIEDLEIGKIYHNLSLRDYNQIIQKGYAVSVGKKPPDLSKIVCINPYVADRGKSARERLRKEEEENQKKKIKRSFENGESFYNPKASEQKSRDDDYEDGYDEEEALFEEMENKVRQKKLSKPSTIQEGFQMDPEFDDVDIDAEDEDLLEEKMVSRSIENKMLNKNSQNKKRPGRPPKQAAA